MRWDTPIWKRPSQDLAGLAVQSIADLSLPYSPNASQGEDCKAAARKVDDAAVKNLQEAINTAGKIVTFGVGREGLALKAFAMRLHHLGYKVTVVVVVCSDALRKCQQQA